MLMATPASVSRPVPLRTGELRSLVGIEDLGLAELASASSSASRQKSVVNVFESRKANTLRLATSRIATKYRKPWPR
jgi:hypothetical protein